MCCIITFIKIITKPAQYYKFLSRYSQRGGKTFLYFFDHRSSINPWAEWMGVIHGYEIEFVFGMPLNASLGYTKNEVNMTMKIMKHWANFARTGYAQSDSCSVTQAMQMLLLLYYLEWLFFLSGIQALMELTGLCSPLKGRSMSL